MDNVLYANIYIDTNKWVKDRPRTVIGAPRYNREAIIDKNVTDKMAKGSYILNSRIRIKMKPGWSMVPGSGEIIAVAKVIPLDRRTQTG